MADLCTADHVELPGHSRLAAGNKFNLELAGCML